MNEYDTPDQGDALDSSSAAKLLQKSLASLGYPLEDVASSTDPQTDIARQNLRRIHKFLLKPKKP